MKITLFNGLNDIKIEERDMPKAGPKDVVLKTLKAGICGTDINILKTGNGQMGIRLGSEFGHEVAAEVIEVGENVSPDIKVGMRVGVNPITARKQGKMVSCEFGGFSEYSLVEDAQLNYNLYAIPDHMSSAAAALVEPLSVGRHGAFSINPQIDENIVVLGAGPIGLCAASSLIAEGITNVCVVDIDPMRLEMAEKLGAKVINTANEPIAEGLIRHFGQKPTFFGMPLPNVHGYIDAAGAPSLFNEVLKVANEQTRFAIVAVYKQPMEIDFGQMMGFELNIRGASGYTHEDIMKVIENLSEKKTPIESIITHTYKFEDIREAFDKAIEMKDTIKVIVDFE